jgi:glycosyltransferase involved in cell wall biosynthesis
MLTPYLPLPPESGGRRRTFELVRRLRDDFDLTLLCLARPQERSVDVRELRELCELHVVPRPESPGLLGAGWKSLTSFRPITMQLYRSEAMRVLASQMATVREFGAVHVESFYMVQNVPRELSDRVVLMEPDVESLAWSRYAEVARPAASRAVVTIEAFEMRAFERRAWREARLVGLVSETDRRFLSSREPDVETFLAPNGVDARFFEVRNGARHSNTAVFLGDYKYFPNVDAALFLVEDILPRVLDKRPDFVLHLAGKDVPPRMRHLGHHPSVQLLGRVDDVRDLLAHASVFVCPLRAGSGTRLKLLEAMACGVPVVTTTLGCEGLDVERGRHLLVADGPEAFAESVVTLLDDRAQAATLSRDGRHWVECHASWNVARQALAEAYRRVSSAASSGGTSRFQS